MKHKKDVEVFILAGGKGTRLKSLNLNVPKPMAPIQGKPFLEILVGELKKQGLTSITLLVGEQAQVIQDHFSSGEKFGVNIQYSHEETPLGTGGAIKLAIENSTKEKFLVLNGDTFFGTSYDLFLKSEFQFSYKMAITYEKDLSRYGKVMTKESVVTGFHEKKSGDDGFINTGLYFFHRNIIKYIADGFVSLENEVLPQLVNEKKLGGIHCVGSFIDIGIPEDYFFAEKNLMNRLSSPLSSGLFLDRDGVIIEDVSYLKDPEQVQIYPGIVPLLKWAQQTRRKIIVVTNQSGIGRGLLTAEDMQKVHDKITEELNKENIQIDGWYYCPFHPEHGQGEYKKKSMLRKPRPGMLMLGAREHQVDITKSIMVGDKSSDVIELPGLKTFLIQGRYDIDSQHKEITYKNHHEILEVVKND